MKHKVNSIFKITIFYYILINFILLMFLNFLGLNTIKRIQSNRYDQFISEQMDILKNQIQDEMENIEHSSQLLVDSIKLQTSTEHILMQHVFSSPHIKEVYFMPNKDEPEIYTAIKRLDDSSVIKNPVNTSVFPTSLELNTNGWKEPFFDSNGNIVVSYNLHTKYQDNDSVLLTIYNLNFLDLTMIKDSYTIVNDSYEVLVNFQSDITTNTIDSIQISPQDNLRYFESKNDQEVFRSYIIELPLSWHLIYTVNEHDIFIYLPMIKGIASTIILLSTTVITAIIQIYYTKEKKKILHLHDAIISILNGAKHTPLKASNSGPLSKLARAIDVLGSKSLKNIKTLEKLAYKNYYTKLSNWAALESEFAYISSQSNFMFVLLDIDNFNHIKNLIGKNTHYDFLVEFSKHLKLFEDDNKKLFHLDQDIFVFVINCTSNKSPIEVGEAIKEHVQGFIFTNESNFVTTCSIGITRYPDDAKDLYTLKACADVALLEAKENRPGAIKLYSRFSEAKTEDLETLKNDLNLALENHEFIIHYQPIFNDKKEIIGFEALLRWQHPIKGLLLPDKFLDLAVKWGYMNQIGELMFNQVVKDAHNILLAGYQIDFISINLSTRELLSPMLISRMLSILRESHLPDNFIAIEIMESSLKYDREKSIKKIQALHVAGLKLIIDDYASSESSLKNIEQLPIDYVKIDANTLTNKDNSKRVTHAILTMLHELNIKTIGKSVDVEKQYKLLSIAESDGYQGLLFEPPKPIEKWLEKNPLK